MNHLMVQTSCDVIISRSSLQGNFFKNLLVPLFLMGCFPADFQEVKRPLRTKSAKRPIKVGKRPVNEVKRPIKAKVLVGVSVVLGYPRHGGKRPL